MDASILPYLAIAEDLEHAGLIWQPEIGDEVAERKEREHISILVDPQGMTPVELRHVYLWLPTVEQLIMQFEARQAILFHAGLELTENAFSYKTVLRSKVGAIESHAASLRTSFGLALRDLLLAKQKNSMH